MRLFALALLLAACRPVDRERVTLRGDGLSVEVIASSLPHQPHARAFGVSSDEPVDLSIRCDGDDTRHEATLAVDGERDWTLFGLLADTDHACSLVARSGERSASGELGFTTDPLADDVPAIEVERTGPETWGAWTLFNHWETGGGGTGQQLLIVDGRGRVRWSRDLEDGGAVGVEARPIDRRTLLVGGGKLPPHAESLGGAVLWSFPEAPGNEYWHHEAAPTSRGTVLGLRSSRNAAGGRSWEGFAIEERTTDGALVWSFDSQEAVDAGVLPVLPGEDPWHANALQWRDSLDGPVVSVSLPRVDRILGIEPDSGAIRWQLGWDTGVALSGTWFTGQHDPEWAGDRVLLHDNGVDVGRSRVVELEVDHDASRAEIAWEWTEEGWFEPLWGDADRLPDGTVLVARGHCGFCPDTGSGTSQLAVVDPASGAVRWRLVLPDPSQGIYRAERIDGCALFDDVGACP